MVDFKKVKAPNNTITRNPAVLAAKADNNIYEAVAVIAKRSNQIAVEMKEELSRKLQEFEDGQIYFRNPATEKKPVAKKD